MVSLIWNEPRSLGWCQSQRASFLFASLRPTARQCSRDRTVNSTCLDLPPTESCQRYLCCLTEGRFIYWGPLSYYYRLFAWYLCYAPRESSSFGASQPQAQAMDSCWLIRFVPRCRAYFWLYLKAWTCPRCVQECSFESYWQRGQVAQLRYWYGTRTQGFRHWFQPFSSRPQLCLQRWNLVLSSSASHFAPGQSRNSCTRSATGSTLPRWFSRKSTYFLRWWVSSFA